MNFCTPQAPTSPVENAFKIARRHVMAEGHARLWFRMFAVIAALYSTGDLQSS